MRCCTISNENKCQAFITQFSLSDPTYIVCLPTNSRLCILLRIPASKFAAPCADVSALDLFKNFGTEKKKE